MFPDRGPANRRRRELGRKLRTLRLDAGYKTQKEVADLTGMSQAMISRIEAAKQVILPRTVRLLCQTYKVGAPLIDHLAEQARVSEERDWSAEYDGTMPDWFGRFAGEEAEAAEILTYEGELVPGLLQTADYARAVAAATLTEPTPDDLQRVVAFRLARQQRLESAHPPLLHAVLNEGVLRRVVGGREVMKGQLKHLTDCAGRVNITLQVLPFSAGAHSAMTNCFTMLRFAPEDGEPTVFVEVDSGALYPDRPIDLDRYTWMFNRLSELALSPNESMALISRVVAEL